jgi:FkbM family methyltransferase
VGAFLVFDGSAGKPVLVSHWRRLALYRNGIAARIGHLLNDYRIPKGFVGHDDVVIDVGANNGELGVWSVSRGARYVGIEPDPFAFRALASNVGPNGALQVAVGPADGTGTLFLDTADADSSLVQPSSEGKASIAVVVRTLDSIVRDLGWVRRIRLLKIEAEGAEPEVLRGAYACLAISEAVAVDADPERHGENTLPEVFNLLGRAGFELRAANLERGTAFFVNMAMVKQ